MASRRGFSLVELLFVIALIALLTAVLVVAASNGLGTAKTQATQSTMIKLGTLLQHRSEALRRSNKMDDLAINAKVPTFLANACGDKQLAKAMAIKSIERTWLPQTWAEASTMLASAGISAPSSTTPDCESAEVLYFLLTAGAAVASLEVDADWLNASVTADRNGNGAKEIVDGWGNPVRFYRWPTRLIRPQGVPNMPAPPPPILPQDHSLAEVLLGNIPDYNSRDLAHDQDYAFDDGGYGCAGYATTDFETEFHTLSTWHTLLVVSAGPDGELGLYEPTDTANYGYLARPYVTNQNAIYDNVTNLNVKSGGK